MIRKLLTAAAIVTLASCSPAADEAGANGAVNLYSSRHYDTDLALYDDFTKETGIKVNRIEAKADALIERIVSEGEFGSADLLITVDAGRLWRAEEAGLLEAVQSDVLAERIPASLRHPDGLWYGLSTRARVIIMNKGAGNLPTPATYADLAKPEYRGAVCMRSSSNIYNLSLLSSIIAHEGAGAAESWAKGMVANFARDPEGNDRANIEAVASGECKLSIVNTYYLARYMEPDEDGNVLFDALTVIFPNQGGTGAHVNVSGAGLVKNAPNKENAIRFLEYLTEAKAQGYFANGNNEYPAVAGIAPTSAIASLGEFKADELSTNELGKNQAEAVAIYDRAGWN